MSNQSSHPTQHIAAAYDAVASHENTLCERLASGFDPSKLTCGHLSVRTPMGGWVERPLSLQDIEKIAEVLGIPHKNPPSDSGKGIKGC